MKGSSWKEYTTPEGKKYYSNIKTKETVWEIPADLKGLKSEGGFFFLFLFCLTKKKNFFFYCIEQLEKAKKLAIEM